MHAQLNKIKTKKQPSPWIVVLTLLFLVGCSSKPKENIETKADAPGLNDIKLTNLKGEEINMSEFKDKTVFINFWATWCRPCIEEMPTIAKAQEIIKDKNVVFLFASNESVDQIQKFKDKKGFPFEYVQIHNLEELNIQALPATFIFNPDGKLTFSEVGYRDWQTPENIALITSKTSKP